MTSELRRWPGSRRIVVNATAGRRARVVRALTGAADWRRDLVERAGAVAVAGLGSARLPRAPAWPWPPLDPTELERRIGSDLPGLRLLGAVVPRQPGRRRLTALAHYAGTYVALKLGPPGSGIETEAAVLGLLAANPLPGIATPEPLHTGVLDLDGGTAITYLATPLVGSRAQRPALEAPLRTFERDLGARLSALTRPAEAPDSHVPVHGDLTPWNLRRTGRGLALFDWEAAGWGPPGSDLAHYRRACRELRTGARR